MFLQFVNGKAWIHDIVLLGSFGTVFGRRFLGKDGTYSIFYNYLSSIRSSMGCIWYFFVEIFLPTPESSSLLNKVMGFSLFTVAIWLIM